jgi:hypothetical protein
MEKLNEEVKMNLNEGRKIVMQMKACVEKLKLPIFSENERIENNQNESYIGFYPIIQFEDVDVDNVIFRVRFYYSRNLIELSIFLHLDYSYLKRDKIIYLLNQINLLSSEGHWSITDCGNEIVLNYATEINKSLPKKYFKQMIKKILYSGKSICPLIIKQIGSNKDPYELACEYYFNNSEIFSERLDFGSSFDNIRYQGPNLSTNELFE